MRKLPAIVLSLLGLLLLATLTSSSAEATSGPVGLNQMRTEAGPAAGQITLNWSRYNPNADNYSISYGTQPGKYIYGVPLTGNTVTYTIGSLTPGVRYYFSLQPYQNGQPLQSVSGEISDVALGTPNTVVGTTGPYGLRGLTVARNSAGSVVLAWTRTSDTTDNYHITYGLQPGNYIYGVINALGANRIDSIGTVYSFKVGALSSGTRYYFALVPTRNGQAAGITAEVSIVAP